MYIVRIYYIKLCATPYQVAFVSEAFGHVIERYSGIKQ